MRLICPVFFMEIGDRSRTRMSGLLEKKVDSSSQKVHFSKINQLLCQLTGVIVGQISGIVNAINSVVWGAPMLALNT